jgi:hypothetical protein
MYQWFPDTNDLPNACSAEEFCQNSPKKPHCTGKIQTDVHTNTIIIFLIEITTKECIFWVKYLHLIVSNKCGRCLIETGSTLGAQ